MIVPLVVVDVPERVEDAGSRERLAVRRALAQRAVEHAAACLGAPADALTADDEGAPVPSGRWCWSRAHTRGLVAGAVAEAAVGVDAEPFSGRRGQPLEGQLRPGEARHLLRDESDLVRLWTARESVLKAWGTGLAGLARLTLACAPERGTPLRARAEDEHDAWAVWTFVTDGGVAVRAWQCDRGAHSVALSFGGALVPRPARISLPAAPVGALP